MKKNMKYILIITSLALTSCNWSFKLLTSFTKMLKASSIVIPNLQTIFDIILSNIPASTNIIINSFIPLFVFENWMPLVICLGGCVFAILLCLLMSGVRALLEMNDVNPI